MSDCSTEAMKPKEPPCFEPKTCGNCGHSISHWTPNRCVCMRGSDSVSIYENEREACSDWDKCSSFNIEQRYQQLEQVARNMMNYMYAIKGSGTAPSSDACHRYEDQLSALGVSLDD